MSLNDPSIHWSVSHSFNFSKASAKLDNSCSAKRSKLIYVVGDSCDNRLDMDPSDCSCEHMSCPKTILMTAKGRSPGALILLI